MSRENETKGEEQRKQEKKAGNKDTEMKWEENKEKGNKSKKWLKKKNNKQACGEDSKTYKHQEKGQQA